MVSKMKLSAALCQWLEDYNPDVIYAQANSREDIVFCIAIRNYLNKPMVFHMMDDWPATNNSGNGFFKHYWSRRIDREFRTLLGQCFALLSISDAMSEEYYKRYNKRFIPFHNPIDVDFWKEHQRNNYQLGSSPVMLYAGRTGLGIDLSLETIAQAVQKVNVSLQRSLKFVLQTAEKPVWAHKYDCVDHQYFVEYHHLPKVFGSVDFLILPYDFSEKAIQYIKYSMPTKASEYMISGTPIIVFGPEETALAQYARQCQWGAVVGKNQVEELSAMIQRLMTELSFRQEIANNAKALAEDRHSSTTVRAAFRKVICSAVHQLQTQN
jgi:glycosyltransferase involved in cell wall biosynthesis